MNRSIVTAAVLAAAVGAASFSQAKLVGDPARIGAFFGAMKYCEARFDEREGRYRLARLRAAREVSEMDSDDKTRALIASRSAENNGRYLGNRLDRDECRALLSLSEWKRFR